MLHQTLNGALDPLVFQLREVLYSNVRIFAIELLRAVAHFTSPGFCVGSAIASA